MLPLLESDRDTKLFKINALEAQKVKNKVCLQKRLGTPPPNHLELTKIFNHLKSNDIFEIDPHEVHFDGYELNQMQIRTIHLINTSGTVERVHVVPPKSQCLNIKYNKFVRLVPGFSIEIKIQLLLSEFCYVYDAIKIQTSHSQKNLVVPVHVYPVLHYNKFPSTIHLSCSQLYNSEDQSTKIYKTLTIINRIPFEFEYFIKRSDNFSNPSIDVRPIEGFILPNSEHKINISYMPKSYGSISITIEVFTSQFNSKPKLCKVFASCMLKKAKLSLLNNKKKYKYNLVDVNNLNTIFSNSERKIQGIYDSYDLEITKITKSKMTAINKVPTVSLINCPYHVSRYLNQKDDSFNVKDRKTIMSNVSNNSTEKSNILNSTSKSFIDKKSSPSLKLIQFEYDLKNIEILEQKNQIRWQTSIGSSDFTTKLKKNIMSEQLRHLRNYQFETICIPRKRECVRTKSELTMFKNFRFIEILNETNQETRNISPKSGRDHINNEETILHHYHRERRDMVESITTLKIGDSRHIRFNLTDKYAWLDRFDALEKFKQYVSRIIIYQRMSRNLNDLMDTLKNWEKMAQTKLTGMLKDIRCHLISRSTEATKSTESNIKPKFESNVGHVYKSVYPNQNSKGTIDNVSEALMSEELKKQDNLNNKFLQRDENTINLILQSVSESDMSLNCFKNPTQDIIYDNPLKPLSLIFEKALEFDWVSKYLEKETFHFPNLHDRKNIVHLDPCVELYSNSMNYNIYNQQEALLEAFNITRSLNSSLPTKKT
ncbi:hypothetical protein A3Q56_02827 [Intoshia linei]|uniref:Primary ciliary dyskinesia protein 1 n=1 Tax=Intoshia linei TaxID=1819745 RepID=A0A177B551_9BILA|nr:hypothetical protein A3Q56_02827 [Intoshia linei]